MTNPIINSDYAGLFLENFFADFVTSTFFKSIIPFYEITSKMLLAKFLNKISHALIIYIGVPQVTAEFAGLIHDFPFNPEFKFLITGHSIGGLIAKSASAVYGHPFIAFESLNYYQSYLSASNHFYAGWDETFEGSKMINLYSPSRVVTQEEKGATMNIKLPKYKNNFENFNPYELTCMMAAGCAVDARYDGFCDAVMGMDNYIDLFHYWGRRRSDYDIWL